MNTGQQNMENTSNTDTEQKQGTDPPGKKPYGAHRIRRETTSLRKDFPSTRSQAKVYRSWITIVIEIRQIDSTTLVHETQGNKTLTFTDTLPTQREAMQYTTIKSIKINEKYGDICKHHKHDNITTNT